MKLTLPLVAVACALAGAAVAQDAPAMHDLTTGDASATMPAPEALPGDAGMGVMPDGLPAEMPMGEGDMTAPPSMGQGMDSLGTDGPITDGDNEDAPSTK